MFIQHAIRRTQLLICLYFRFHENYNSLIRFLAFYLQSNIIVDLWTLWIGRFSVINSWSDERCLIDASSKYGYK